MKTSLNLSLWRRPRVAFSTSIFLICTAGFAGIAEAQTQKKSQSIYRSSFSKPEVFVNEVIPDSMKGKKDTSEVPSMNSFPLRVQVSESDINGWNQPKMVADPKKISKGFKVSSCEFTIVSGEFAVRHYNGDSPEDLMVVADAVMPQSTFSVDGEEEILFSLSTMLTVSVDPKFQKACKDAFFGKKFAIGHASLAGSSFYGVGKKGDAVNAAVYRAESPSKLYITWNAESKNLTLQDQIGIVPDIESAVFSMKFSEKDSYYLGFDAEFKILKEKPIVAGNH